MDLQPDVNKLNRKLLQIKLNNLFFVNAGGVDEIVCCRLC